MSERLHPLPPDIEVPNYEWYANRIKQTGCISS